MDDKTEMQKEIKRRQNLMRTYTGKIAEDWVRKFADEKSYWTGNIGFYNAVEAVEMAVFAAIQNLQKDDGV